MAACCGTYHTVTLSNDGTLYSFGKNCRYSGEGQPGLEYDNDVSLPTPIPNLPQITQISCGYNFTICVDCEGFVRSFGENNNYSQLGTVQQQISIFLKKFKIFLLVFLSLVDIIIF